jgi:archaemetzincin
MIVFLQPLGEVDIETLNFLKQSLNCLWPTEILPQIDISSDAYNKNRRQYNGQALLETFQVRGDATLGITQVDTYAQGLNFIFGLALGKKALISLKRLKQEFYGLSDDEDLFKSRVLKEAVHELGHGFGLSHCPNRKCVMHFLTRFWILM